MSAGNPITSRTGPRSLLWLMLLAGASATAAEPPASAEVAPKSSPASRPASADAMPAVTSPAVTVNKSDPGPAPKATGAQPVKRAGSDRLDLDTTVVTGNRELPKVLYIVPWKRSDLGDLPPQPLNTLLDEVLTPVDRDVFRREVTYYGAMTEPDGATKAAPATSGAASEK